jgi:hypothetical protein
MATQTENWHSLALSFVSTDSEEWSEPTLPWRVRFQGAPADALRQEVLPKVTSNHRLRGETLYLADHRDIQALFRAYHRPQANSISLAAVQHIIAFQTAHQVANIIATPLETAA